MVETDTVVAPGGRRWLSLTYRVLSSCLVECLGNSARVAMSFWRDSA
jgi:hypothetical protein